MKFTKIFSHYLTHPDPMHKSFYASAHPSQEGTKKSPFKGGKHQRCRGMAFGAIFLVVLLIQPSLLFAQDYTTTIHKTAHFTDVNNAENELRVFNINGPVTVEGYDGNEIQVTAEEQIEGNDEEVQRAKKELQFKVERSGNNVLVYLDAPFIELKHENGHISYNIHRNDDNGSYHFLFDIRIRMPKQAAIHASTINKGNVSISHTTGEVFASNINGGVTLNHISGETHASTINGKITARYDKNPDKDSEYHTINGKIEAYYPKDLSADIRFKSMHGDIYTDFPDVHRLTAKIQRDTDNSGSSTIYRVDRFTPVRIGRGGPTLKFNVLNGDVYIKQIKS